MDKVAVFVVIFGLCFERSLQDKVQKKNFDSLMTFLGQPVVPTGFSSGLNRTKPPALLLNSNKTASYLQGPISTILIPVLYILILAVGVPANLFTLCSLVSKVRKVSCAILYFSLALSDLLLLLSLVFKAHYHLQGNQWPFGETACRVVSACFYGNLYCSAQTLAAISVKHYLALVHPFTHRSLPKRKCTTWVMVVLWMVFGAGLVPELLVRQSYWIQELDIITCHDILPLMSNSHKYLLYYNLVLTVFGLLVPLVVSVLCYVRILVELNQSHSELGFYIRSSSFVFFIFLVCFTPAGVLHLVHYVQLFANGTEGLYMYFNVAVCLCCLHAAMVPFLFMLMSRSTGSKPYFRTFMRKSLSI
ncbi:proteinase-activated receptor 3-like [Eucyclogobius newberryi]|uniref:proteinase-activated receptor 3-like n=1 Tax=Eucyclogobius newberryi TaxID=166745 RepID=UPI003B5A5E6C